MPAFSFEKLPPPVRRESAPAAPANPPSRVDTRSKSDQASKVDYLAAIQSRSRRGFVVQMLDRLTRSRARQ